MTTLKELKKIQYMKIINDYTDDKNKEILINKVNILCDLKYQDGIGLGLRYSKNDKKTIRDLHNEIMSYKDTDKIVRIHNRYWERKQ